MKKTKHNEEAKRTTKAAKKSLKSRVKDQTTTKRFSKLRIPQSIPDSEHEE